MLPETSHCGRMEATPEQAAEGAALVKVLASVLDRLVLSNATLARQDPGQVTKFHALKAPGIGILPYLERYVTICHSCLVSSDHWNVQSDLYVPSCPLRIQQYASCSNECFILALIYIDRLIQRNNFLLTELNVHRVVITAILLAAKFFDDAYYNNAYYSKVGGVLVSEMNGLEVDFLFRINFSLHVSPEEFEKYKDELVAHSFHAAHQVPAVSPLMPPVEEPALPAFNQSQALAAPLPLMPTPSGQDQHHRAQQVTPSVMSQNFAMAADNYAQQALEHQAALAVAEQHLLSTRQQLLHRANSLPPFSSTGSGRCSYSAAKQPYHSAPMVSMLPAVGTDEQYMLAVGQQLLPLQTTLVHHNHGVHHENFAQTAGGPAYQLPGSLVGGRF